MVLFHVLFCCCGKNSELYLFEVGPAEIMIKECESEPSLGILAVLSRLA